jgi:DNA-binding transcriptional regulator YhcF (GntR family)
MPRSDPPRTDPTSPGKHAAIAADLRARIIAGALEPGARLPTCPELEAEFQASRMTVLKALDRLKRDQFIRTDGRRGTFVAERPPQLYRYALVFAEHQLSRFSQALFEAAEGLQRETPRRLPAFFGVDGHADVEDYERLVADVRGQRLAGVIFVSQPGPLAGTPIFGPADLPRVALVEEPDVPGVGAVSLDQSSYIAAALEHFRARKRRRIAILTNGHRSQAWLSEATGQIARRGMTTRPAWTLAADVRFPHWVPNSVAALFDARPGARPDALLIGDDHLVEHATRALLEMGLAVPRDVEVIAHANFPCRPPAAVPVTW